MKLSELFTKYGSDKDTAHSYGPWYDTTLGPRQYSVATVLEVGVQRGFSLMALRDFFVNAHISGMDNGDDENVVMHNSEWGERISSFAHDSTKPMPSRFPDGWFDIIIDDGSHQIDDQLATFRNLWPKLEDGGIYVCEDLQGVENAQRMVDEFGGRIEDLRSVKGRADDVLWWKEKTEIRKTEIRDQ